jgi:serine/threonine-protein kinase HipA
MTGLAVYFETRKVGDIQIGAGGPSFTYDPTWLTTRGAFPISLRMPLAPEPVPPDVFLTWATNLLPEGTQLRALGTALGASPEDVVAILGEIGRDTAGALSFGRPGTTRTVSPASWRPVANEADLERIIMELPRKPFLAGEDGVSMSLAGVQSKLAVAIDAEGRVCIPLDGAPSTHILKPDSGFLFGGVQNEALCLTLARRCGARVPALTTGRAGARTYFLIQRYDRRQTGDRWRRLHQEDFCQALGKPPAAKYEANQTGIKGPTVADMFALTRARMSAGDILRLVDHVILNVIACNTDAHAKNYSLLLSARGAELAPIYDIMCADVWDGVTRNLSQKIAGKARGEHLKRRHWEQFARDCGLNPTRLVARVAALCATAQKEVAAAAAEVEAMPAGGHLLLPKAAEAIETRVRALLAGLDEERLPTPITRAPKRPAAKAKAAPRPRAPRAKRARKSKPLAPA